jgi:hypothetical protein
MSKAADHEETGFSLSDSESTYENLICATRGRGFVSVVNTDGCAAFESTVPKQGLSFAAAWLGAFPAASRVDPCLAQMARDKSC